MAIPFSVKTMAGLTLPLWSLSKRTLKPSGMWPPVKIPPPFTWLKLAVTVLVSPGEIIVGKALNCITIH